MGRTGSIIARGCLVLLMACFAAAASLAADPTRLPPETERFYGIEMEMQAAYAAGDDAQVTKLAKEYLELAAAHRDDWNYGNAVHDGNRYQGLVSLRAGRVEEAARFLSLAGKTPGSPQLNSFGPVLDLADALLKLGQAEAVKAYLRDIRTFWAMGEGSVDEWLAAIDRGETPRLDRFAATKPSLWMIAVGWGVMLWPALIVVLFLYAGRRSVERKGYFLLVALLASYASFLAAGAAIIWRMVDLTEWLAKLGWMAPVWVPLAAIVLAPVLVVLGVFKGFARPAGTLAHG